jgi:hypothetical protein
LLQALVLGLLAVVSIASVAVFSRHQQSATELFHMSASELGWASTDPIVSSLAQNSASSYANAAQNAMASAKHDDNIISEASRDEHAAQAVAKKDEAELSSLYQGRYFNTGDPLGLHTNDLPDLESISSLNGRFSMALDAADSDADDTMVNHVTNTQLSGLESELNDLASKKDSIVDSLMLQRQSTAVTAAHDATYADSIRLRRAQNLNIARAIRAAMQAAKIAKVRAREASVIQQNEDAIARIARERAARLSSYRSSSMSGSLQTQSNMRKTVQDQRDAADRRYHSAMGMYTNKLQVGQDT